MLKIVEMKNTRFGTARFGIIVSGFSLYVDGKGFVSFSNDSVMKGVAVPYVNKKEILQEIIDSGFSAEAHEHWAQAI